jgi:bifunctional DNA-binding transcriptional regulator/antitoxin component of YhaV-PrlF toxin-antitoxin module
MFIDKILVGSAPIGNDGRITIPIRIRELLSLEDGKDDLVFKLDKDTNTIIIERGEMEWD